MGFLKLDFEKRHNRVSHPILWGTLEVMGLNLEAIDLVKGILVNARSKVHVNGFFTKSFELQQGVRQGSPLTLILFALSTQSLMRLFEEKKMSGEITRLVINENEKLPY